MSHYDLLLIPGPMRDNETLDEYARRCVLLKNVALPPATSNSANADESDGARKD